MASISAANSETEYVSISIWYKDEQLYAHLLGEALWQIKDGFHPFHDGHLIKNGMFGLYTTKQFTNRQGKRVGGITSELVKPPNNFKSIICAIRLYNDRACVIMKREDATQLRDEILNLTDFEMEVHMSKAIDNNTPYQSSPHHEC